VSLSLILSLVLLTGSASQDNDLASWSKALKDRAYELDLIRAGDPNVEFINVFESLLLEVKNMERGLNNCQPERIINLLPYWANALEDTYVEMWANKDNDSWSDSAVGDALFDIAHEMRVYANECHVND